MNAITATTSSDASAVTAEQRAVAEAVGAARGEPEMRPGGRGRRRTRAQASGRGPAVYGRSGVVHKSITSRSQALNDCPWPAAMLAGAHRHPTRRHNADEAHACGSRARRGGRSPPRIAIPATQRVRRPARSPAPARRSSRRSSSRCSRPTSRSSTGNTVNYSGVGSGAGITAITSKTVDFGASDAPLTGAAGAACGCVEIAVGALGDRVRRSTSRASAHLNVSGPVLAEIYLGTDHDLERPEDRRRSTRARRCRR